VRFVILGGLAVTISGSSDVTFDLGFSHARDRGNLSRLAQALSPFHPPRGRSVPAHRAPEGQGVAPVVKQSLS
jgi:hypothetical protein